MDDSIAAYLETHIAPPDADGHRRWTGATRPTIRDRRRMPLAPVDARHRHVRIAYYVIYEWATGAPADPNIVFDGCPDDPLCVEISHLHPRPRLLSLPTDPSLRRRRGGRLPGERPVRCRNGHLYTEVGWTEQLTRGGPGTHRHCNACEAAKRAKRAIKDRGRAATTTTADWRAEARRYLQEISPDLTK